MCSGGHVAGLLRRTSFPSLLVLRLLARLRGRGGQVARPGSLQRGCKDGGSPLPGRVEARGGCGKRLAPVVWVLQAVASAHAFNCERFSDRAPIEAPPGGGCKLKKRSGVTCLCNPSHRAELKSRFPRGVVIRTARARGGCG